jgi:hypothetical protein
MPTKKTPHLKLVTGTEVSGTVVIKKSVFHANEDGTTETKVIGVHLNTESDTFEIVLPEHLVIYRSSGEEGGNLATVRATTAAEVVSRYESISENYSRWRLSLNGERMLWVGTHAKLSDFARTTFGIDASVSLGLKPVSRYTDKTHGDSIVVIDKQGNPQGEVTPLSIANPILIADTPENRAKVQSLIDSITQAAAVIDGARSAPDPAAYIQAINDKWSTDTPVQPDLFTSATPAPPPAVNPDDEEL